MRCQQRPKQAIQHPTAGLIARSATAVDDIIGDGTTTQVLLVGEILHQVARSVLLWRFRSLFV